MTGPVPHKKVEFWDDERKLGNSLIVTLVRGWKFNEDVMAVEHVLGFDTKAEALNAVRASVQCDCKDCAISAKDDAPTLSI